MQGPRTHCQRCPRKNMLQQLNFIPWHTRPCWVGGYVESMSNKTRSWPGLPPSTLEQSEAYGHIVAGDKVALLVPCHSCQLQKPLGIKTFPESCWGAHTDSLRCKFWGNWWKLCEITVASALSCQGDSWISEQISNLFSAASDAPGGSQLRATASASAESWDLATC
jgi:hypothetical protein